MTSKRTKRHTPEQIVRKLRDAEMMLAATKASGPSVAQARTQDVRPKTLAPLLVALLHQYENKINAEHF